MDFTVPYDTRVDCKESEKIEKYHNLAQEVKKLWNLTVEVISLVMDALGTHRRSLNERLGKIGIKTKSVDLQKSAILEEFFEQFLSCEMSC